MWILLFTKNAKKKILPSSPLQINILFQKFEHTDINSKINTESYVDRSARRANRAAWKQSQCVASGQTTQYFPLGQQSLNRSSSSALSYTQQSSVSISSGSVSSIASSLATSAHGSTGV